MLGGGLFTVGCLMRRVILGIRFSGPFPETGCDWELGAGANDTPGADSTFGTGAGVGASAGGSPFGTGGSGFDTEPNRDEVLPYVPVDEDAIPE